MKKQNSTLLNPVASLASVEHIAKLMRKNAKRRERLEDTNIALRDEMIKRLLSGREQFPTLRENFAVLSCDGEYDSEVIEQYKILEENFGCAQKTYFLIIQRGYIFDEDDEMIFINRIFVAEPRDDAVQYGFQRGLMGLPVQGGTLLSTENIFEDVIYEVTLWIEDAHRIFVGPLVNYLCHEKRLDVVYEDEDDEDRGVMMNIHSFAPVYVFFHPFPFSDIEAQFGIPCEKINLLIRHYITKRTQGLGKS